MVHCFHRAQGEADQPAVSWVFLLAFLDNKRDIFSPAAFRHLSNRYDQSKIIEWPCNHISQLPQNSWVHAWMLRQCLCIPSRLPMFASTPCMLLSCVWIWPGAPCSSTHARWHFLPDFILTGMDCFLVWRRWSRNINKLSWASLPSRVLSHGIHPSFEEVFSPVFGFWNSMVNENNYPTLLREFPHPPPVCDISWEN